MGGQNGGREAAEAGRRRHGADADARRRRGPAGRRRGSRQQGGGRGPPQPGRESRDHHGGRVRQPRPAGRRQRRRQPRLPHPGRRGPAADRGPQPGRRPGPRRPAGCGGGPPRPAAQLRDQGPSGQPGGGRHHADRDGGGRRGAALQRRLVGGAGGCGDRLFAERRSGPHGGGGRIVAAALTAGATDNVTAWSPASIPPEPTTVPRPAAPRQPLSRSRYHRQPRPFPAGAVPATSSTHLYDRVPWHALRPDLHPRLPDRHRRWLLPRSATQSPRVRPRATSRASSCT